MPHFVLPVNSPYLTIDNRPISSQNKNTFIGVVIDMSDDKETKWFQYLARKDHLMVQASLKTEAAPALSQCLETQKTTDVNNRDISFT